MIHITNEVRNRIIRTRNNSESISLNFKPETHIDKWIRLGRVSPNIGGIMKQMWEAMNEIYPDRCSFMFDIEVLNTTHVNSYGSNHVREFTVFDKFIIHKIYCVIHFPEFEITNSLGDSHIIKDLFVRIPIAIHRGTDSLYLETVEGLRTTVSTEEFSSRYEHSHLHSKSYDEKVNRTRFTTFCTGTGDINSVTSLLNMGFDIDNFKLLLLQIDPFVKWESIEGVPYRRMSSIAIKGKASDTLELLDVITVGENILRLIKQHRLAPSWRLRDRQSITIDVGEDKLDDLILHPTTVSEISGVHGQYLFLVDEDGNYYQEAEEDLVNSIGVSDQWIPFRGSKIYFTVVGRPIRIISRKRYIHPQIRSYVKSKLEYLGNLPQIRKAGIKKLNPSVHS